MTRYPKRLIEVDLPIKRISAHARREKSIRHGHISTLHIWWARRPLAACRAVICAALWPDPADESCPPAFREAAAKIILGFARKVTTDTKLANDHCSPENYKAWSKLVAASGSPSPGGEGRGEGERPTDFLWLRSALLDFIADFANWDNSTVREYLDTSRALTQAAHEALGGAPGTRPLVVDPFCGGGSIPLEALRVGADAFASDLNPVPVLLNKVVLEYIPKYGQRLADEVRKWGAWIKPEAEKELAEFYPKDADGATPIAYLWARTIQCEGPGCGAEVPLIRSLWLAKKANRSVALQLVPNKKAKRVDFQIIVKQPGGWVDQNDYTAKISDPNFDGTVKRGSATCPCCGYTTQVARLREQFKARRGGANDARFLCVVTTQAGQQGRGYRLPTRGDLNCVQKAATELERKSKAHNGPLSLVPDEAISVEGSYRINKMIIYGAKMWGDLFSARQALCLTTLAGIVEGLDAKIGSKEDKDFSNAVRTLLAFAVDRQADYNSSICRWVAVGEFIGNTFGRQAIPIIWDYCEVSPLSESTGGFSGACDWIFNVLKREAVAQSHHGHVERASATRHPLPSDSADALITDPPYYHAIAYATLSDFFYVWLRKSLKPIYPDLYATLAVPKAEELVATPYRHGSKQKAETFFLDGMTQAMHNLAEKAHPAFPVTIYYAFKQSDTKGESGTSNTGWDTFLQAVLDAGFAITGTWPMRTELGNRMIGSGTNALASSIVLVCRQRAHDAATIGRRAFIRELYSALPDALDEMTRGGVNSPVAPVDLSQAIIGPGMAIFSQYSAVLEADGSKMSVKTALQLINRFFAEDDFDHDTQFCLAWFEQNGWATGKYGEADVLARAKGTSVGGLADAGVLESSAGDLRLLRWAELDAEWSPEADARTPVWEALHQLIRALNHDGESAAGSLLARMPARAEPIRALAYRLYTLCERQGRAEDARAYNELVTAWTGIETAAAEAGPVNQQIYLDI